MPRSEGFILPLMLVLFLIFSLLIVLLYQVEENHIAVFHAVRNDAAHTRALGVFEKEALTLASQSSLTLPNPTNTPVNNVLYLRFIDPDTNLRIFQEKFGPFMVLIECNAAKQCKLRQVRRSG